MLHLAAIDLKRQTISILFIPVCENKPIHADPVVSALVERALAFEEFMGKEDQEITLYQPPGCAAERVVLRGLGKAEALDAETLRQMAGKCVKRCIQLGLARMWLAAPDPAATGMEETEQLKALMEGAFRQPPFRPVQTAQRKEAPGAHRRRRSVEAGRPTSPPAGRDRDGLRRRPERAGMGQPALQRKTA